MTKAPREDGRATERSAAKSPGAWALFLAVTAIGLFVDLWTKYLAFGRLAPDPVRIDREAVIELTRSDRSLAALIPDHTPTVVVPHLLEFTLVLNRGAVFGLGAGQRWVFVVFTVVAVGIGLWAFARWTTARDRLVHVLIALVLAGGLGNLYDRLKYASVRDFLHPLPGVKYPFGISTPWSGRDIWPYVSNVADAFLLIGIIGLMFTLMKSDKPRKNAAACSQRELITRR